MDRPADLVEQAKAMGATFELTTNGVKVRRREGPLPSDLLEELRRHKDDIRAGLVNHLYTFENPNTRQREEELEELVRRVEEEGYVLLWCEVVQDLVAFHRSDVDPAAIPAGFVPYSDDELHDMFGDDGVKRSPDALRLIHAAKRSGVAMPGSAEDEVRTADDEHHRI